MNPELLTSLQIGAVFKESENTCVGLCFSRDGSCLGAGFEDGTVSVIDSDTAKIARTHRSHKYGLSKFAFMNNDARGSLAVAAGCPAALTDFTLRVWDLVHNRFCRVFRAHEKPVTSVSPHASKDLLVSSSADGLSCLWDIRDEKPVWQNAADAGSTSAFDRAEGSMVFAISNARKITLYDARNTQAALKEITKISSPIDEMVFAANGQRLLIGSHKLGAVSTVNIGTGISESMFFLQPTRTRFNLTTSPCSSYGMATTPSNAVDIWDIKTRVKVRSLVGHDGPPIGTFSTRDAMIATASMPVALWVPLLAKPDN